MSFLVHTWVFRITQLFNTHSLTLFCTTKFADMTQLNVLV